MQPLRARLQSSLQGLRGPLQGGAYAEHRNGFKSGEQPIFTSGKYW